MNVPTAGQAITTTGTKYECLLVPSTVDTGKQTVTLTLTIDNDDKTVTLSDSDGVIFAQGTKSNITLTLSNNVIIRASSFQGKGLVCNIGGNAQCVRTLADDIPRFKHETQSGRRI